MAKGDAVVNIVAVAGDSAVSVQPASGVEWLITTVTTSGDGATAGYADLYDGTNDPSEFLFPGNNIGEGDANGSCIRDGRVFVNNTIYFKIFNHNANTRNVSYSGVQWK